MSRKSGDLASEVARYLSRCVRDGECAVLPGTDRYGDLSYNRGSRIKAHRASYIVHKGPIPDGMVVRHACDNPPCVNPDHLDVGTDLDNMADMVRRGRSCIGLKQHSAAIPPDAIMRAVSEYLSGGQSQAALARKYGVAQSTLGRWIRAEARMDVPLAGVKVGKGSRIATGIQPCGTRAGYIRHRHDGEPICEPCRQANIAYFRAYREKQRRLISP